MKIGLLDIDGHNWPNLCLMKLSAYHKARGDPVEWWRPESRYDRVYKSRVFTDTYSKDTIVVTNAKEVIRGGTGYGPGPDLPNEVEHICPDYTLYPQFPDTAFVGTSSISLASAQARKLTHYAVPPLPIKTASLGFDGDPHASPAKRVAWGEETQGSGRSFRRQAETELSGLCGDEMVYERPSAPQITRRLQRWVNNKRIFHTVQHFEDYKP